MGTVSTPRGPLPARVYWVRRLVLVAALVLVVGGGAALAGLVGGGEASTGGAPERAVQAGAEARASASPTVRRTPRPAPVPRRGRAADSPPSGPCRAATVVVKGATRSVTGGSPATLTLRLRSLGGTCTFEVSSETVAARITSGSDRIWSSQDCPRSLPTRSLVVRDNRWVSYDLAWSGRRSEEGCPGGLSWAEGGYYHLAAATLGGRPSDVQFRVVAPKRPVVTRTTTATPRPRTEKTGD